MVTNFLARPVAAGGVMVLN